MIDGIIIGILAAGIFVIVFLSNRKSHSELLEAKELKIENEKVKMENTAVDSLVDEHNKELESRDKS